MNTINLNQVECVKSITNLGSTTYKNICDGSSATVGWGIFEWVIIGVLVALILVMIIESIKLATESF